MPKVSFFGRKRLEVAVYEAAVVFNAEEKGIFSHLGLSVSMFMKQGFMEIDRRNVVETVKQVNEPAKYSRKRRQVAQAATRRQL